MDIGIGLDPMLNLDLAEQAEMSREAARLGYSSIWTPEGTGQDSFQICMHRWAASAEVEQGGLTTGIAVSPVMWRSPAAFAMSGGTMSQITGGRFIMGIGVGGAYRPDVRKSMGLPRMSALALMRDYLCITRALVAGGTVDYEGETCTLRSLKLGINPPPRTPVYLGALGPKMLQLAGELADGAALNWCDPDQIEWSRERIAEGAEKANRDPSELKVAEYIRVCVDEDEEVARVAFAKATMYYALGPKVPTAKERTQGYRAHFERMGFTKELAELDERRNMGASRDEVAAAFPADLLLKVGYFGKPEGAAAAFARLSNGLDTAIVRVVAARPGTDSARAVMRACEPAKVRAS